MYKINLVNKDWEFITVVTVHAVPRVGEFIFNREQEQYYIVDAVTHDIIKRRFFGKKTVISVIISPTNMSI